MDFVSPDPKAMVRAANVRATLEAFELRRDWAERTMAKHELKLDELTADRLVPVQRWLDALKDIQDKVGTGHVRQVGSKIVENAHFPPHLSSVEAVLEALDAIYYLNHQGEVGHYVTTRNADGTVTVRCETPYPRQFERGLVEGICRNPRLAGTKRYVVRFADGPPEGNTTCILTVLQLP